MVESWVVLHVKSGVVLGHVSVLCRLSRRQAEWWCGVVCLCIERFESLQLIRIIWRSRLSVELGIVVRCRSVVGYVMFHLRSSLG